MSDQVLTKTQIEDIFRSITMTILGLPEKDNQNKPINQDKVRVAWSTTGSPAWKITDDIVFIKVSLSDDPIIQQRDVIYSPITNTNTSSRIVTYTKCHLIEWVLYGPCSYDKADLIRNGIFLPQITETLLTNKLALITTVPAPRRAPELFNGQWWERCDLQASFNEEVIRTGTGTIGMNDESLLGPRIQMRPPHPHLTELT